MHRQTPHRKRNQQRLDEFRREAIPEELSCVEGEPGEQAAEGQEAEGEGDAEEGGVGREEVAEGGGGLG
jgi:hypothetical protein